jgi:hypothetical protein
MDEHTVDLSTPLGPVTVHFGKGRLTGTDVATVCAGPGFGIGHREYHGEIVLTSPGWAEPPAGPLSGAVLATPDGRVPVPRERAAMVAVIRAAVAAYAVRPPGAGSPRGQQ